MIHIVLYQPEIPPNTGNIARLCVCNDLKLHIIHPIGFSLQKKALLRAGLDYWDSVDLVEHSSWNAFKDQFGPSLNSRAYFFSSKSSKSFWEVTFPDECLLIFGSETRGLPAEIHQNYPGQVITLPMQGSGARCLNLSSSVSIAAYEVMRQKLRVKENP